MLEHPEIFCTSLIDVGGGYTDFWGDKTYNLFVFNLYDNNEIDNMKAQLNAKISEITNKLSNYNDLRKVYEIHDLIAKNCTYDYSQKDISMPKSELDIKNDFNSYIEDQKRIAKTNAKYYESHSIYGALISGKAVCEGYAKAAKILYNKSGIESGVITNEKHAWNYVKVNGNYYQMDITGDDGGDEETSYPYRYFNIRNKELAADIENRELHKATSNNVPSCNDATFDNIFRTVDSNGALDEKYVTRIEDKFF